MGTPRLTIAVALFVLAALAATMTYTGYLLIGVLSDYFETSRFVTGLLLGALFARFPWIRQGKPRIVGLLPKPARRPLMVGLLALSLLHYATQGDVGPVLVTGFTLAFVLGFPLLRKALFARVSSKVFNFGAGRNTRAAIDDNVIEGEFRERKE